MNDISTPVLVLNAIHHGALGLTRSLGRLGVAIYSQAPHRFVPVFFSRYSQRNFVWDMNAAGAEKTVEFLISLGRRLPRPTILIPTCDVTALLLADYDSALREWFVFPRQRRDIVHALCSKRGLYELARSLGIPTPETSFPQSREDLLRFLANARFPVVLKTVKNRIGQKTLGFKVILQNRQELLRHYDRLEDPDDPNLMVQEYIPGGDDANCMFNGYFDANSDCLFGFTGKKVRQFPAYAGVTSLGVCQWDDTVANAAKTFMKAIGYKGPLDCGYRFDARDGQYKVYDVNPRIGATFRLFVDSSGMDVARALYLDLTGQTVTVGTIEEKRKWILEDGDSVSSLRYFFDRRLTLRNWVQSLRGIEETAIYARDDLYPIAGRTAQNLRTLLLRSIPPARVTPPETASHAVSEQVVSSHSDT